MEDFRALSEMSVFHGYLLADFVSEIVSTRHQNPDGHPRTYLARQLVWTVGDLIERQTTKVGKTHSSSELRRHPSAPNDDVLRSFL